MSMYSQVSGIMSKKIIKSGDPVVLFFIKKSKRASYYLDKSTRTLLGNEGCEALYNPVALPINATFDECEFLIDIENSDNVKDIEEKTGLSLSRIIEMTGDEREKEEDQQLNNLLNEISICLEHRDIFNTMVSVDRDNRSYKDCDLYQSVLERLGFEFVEDVGDRYFKKMVNPNLSEYVIYSDALAFAKILKKGEEVPRIYNLGHLLEELNVSSDIFEGDTVTSLSIVEAQRMKKEIIYQEQNDRKDEIMKELYLVQNGMVNFGESASEKLMKMLNELEAIKNNSNLGKLTKKEQEKNERYHSFVRNYERFSNKINNKNIFELDIKRLEDLQHFISAMWSTSSLFMPTFSGYNDCGSTYEKELHEAIGKLF